MAIFFKMQGITFTGSLNPVFKVSLEEHYILGPRMIGFQLQFAATSIQPTQTWSLCISCGYIGHFTYRELGCYPWVVSVYV